MLKDLVKSRLKSIYGQGKEELEDEAVKEIQEIMDELPLVDEKSMELEEWGLPVLVPSPEGDVEGRCPTENMVVGESASASGGLREIIEKEIEAVVEALPSMEAEYRKAVLLLAFLPNRLDDRSYRRLSDLGHQMKIFSPELLPLQPPQPPQQPHHPQQPQLSPRPQPPQRRKRTFTLTLEIDDGELENFKAGGSPMQQDDPLTEEIKEEKVALHDIKWEEEEEGGYICLAANEREEEKEEKKLDNNNIKWGREEEEDEVDSINRFPAWSVAVGGFISRKRKRGASSSDDMREERHRGEEKEKEKMKEEEEDVVVVEEEEGGGGEGRLYHLAFQAHHHPFHPWQLPLSVPMYNNATTQHPPQDRKPQHPPQDRKPQHPQLQHVQQQIPIWQQHFPPNVWGQQPQHPQHPHPPQQQPQNALQNPDDQFIDDWLNQEGLAAHSV